MIKVDNGLSISWWIVHLEYVNLSLEFDMKLEGNGSEI